MIRHWGTALTAVSALSCASDPVRVEQAPTTLAASPAEVFADTGAEAFDLGGDVRLGQGQPLAQVRVTGRVRAGGEHWLQRIELLCPAFLRPLLAARRHRMLQHCQRPLPVEQPRLVRLDGQGRLKARFCGGEVQRHLLHAAASVLRLAAARGVSRVVAEGGDQQAPKAPPLWGDLAQSPTLAEARKERLGQILGIMR